MSWGSPREVCEQGARIMKVRVLVTSLALLLVGACGGIPTSGPVTRVAADDGFGESTVRYAPAQPAAGASPQQIVRGYLDAMLAFPVSTGTASEFLTPKAAKSWRSLDGVQVYARPEVSVPVPSDRGTDVGERGAGRVDVTLTTSQVAHLDQQGRYTSTTGPDDLTYTLEQVDGEWRIVNPQGGILVNNKFFTDYFRPFDIYMFDRPGRRLIPVPVYLAAGDQLATSLVASLARGPAADVGDTMRTYVPKLETLRASVPISVSGVADVEFDEEFRVSSSSTQDRLSAQIVWTLRQVPEIKGVRLSGGSTVVSRNGVPVQPIGSWGAFGPSTAGAHAFTLVDNRVMQIDEDRVAPLSGAWGKDAHGAVRIAVSDAGVAGVLAGRSDVRITNRIGASATAVGGSMFATPRWDRDGVLWLVDRNGTKARIRLVIDDVVSELAIGSVANLDISTFTLSPGGSRYAVTADGGVYVGMIERSDKNKILRLGEPQRVPVSAAAPTSAIWATDTQLSFLADSESGRQVHFVRIDGSEATGGATGTGALLPDVGANILVAGSGDPPPRYATDDRQRIWYLPTDGTTWRVLKARNVTGLTYGR